MENNFGENFNVSVYFPRYGERSDVKLEEIITKAKESLDIAIFNFTDKDILESILEAKKHDVEIRIITDKMMSLTPIQFFILRKLKKAGIPIKRNSHRGFMHLKITISDKKTVTVASANFTKSSQIKNDEFFMIIQNEKTAYKFIRQFELMWNKTEDFSPF